MYDILAFYIPAVSSPAGKVAVRISGDSNDVDLNNLENRDNGWGRIDVRKGENDISWLHSDIKNMAYYYIYPAFDKILQKGNLK